MENKGDPIMINHLVRTNLRFEQPPARETEPQYFARLAREAQLRRRRERRRRVIAALRPHGRRAERPGRRDGDG
jgi:hypothetical protein